MMNTNELAIPACNNTSVGILSIDEQGRVLLLERKKFPFGMACPAGHVEEGETYEHAAVRELQEETGYQATELTLRLEIGIANQCRRPGGTWHLWRVYQAQVAGELIHNTDEASQVGWFPWQDILEWKLRTEAYQAGYILEQDWQAWPGLEPVWYDFFHRLGWW